MDNAAHTPGPWRIDEDDRPNMEWNIHIVEAARPHHRVCFMASDGPNEANARLIAAAPDMLAALKAVVAIADRRTDEFDAARGAIAKAQGTTP